jgi:uncharacterized protein
VIIDAHVHVDDVPALGWHLPAELVLKQMDEAGVDVSVIMTITDAPEVNAGALELLAEVRQQHPGRFELYARMHPWYGDTAERMLVRAIRELGYAGLKLHPVSTIGHPADETSLRLMRVAARFGAPTLLHCGDDPFCTPLECEQAAVRAPEATIVLAHLGAYCHGADAITVCERNENVMIDTSCCPYPWLIREAVDRCGAERILWGSDGPGCPPGIELAKLDRAGLTASERELLVYGNQRRLLDGVDRR